MGLSKREIWSFVITGAILLVIAVTLPAPVKEIDGERVIVINGYIVPKWLSVAFIALVFVGICALVYRALHRVGSKEDEVEMFELEDVYPKAGGGFIAWKPDVPGTPSPMNYERPNFTAKTTASEFLTAQPPDPMRVLILGEKDSFRELYEFNDLQAKWLDTAPEATLRDLLPTGEEWVLAGSEDIAHLLRQAHSQRGIPSAEDLEALAARVSNEEVRRALLDQYDEVESADGPSL